MKKSPLRKALALIDTPEKWVKGHYTDGNGRFCAVGACENAQVGVATLYRVRAIETNDFDASVTNFNDDNWTTHEDVMALFDLAIAFDEVGGP